MYQRPCSRNLTYLALGGVLLLALVFSSVPSASAGRPIPSPAVEITEALTNTPVATVTATTSPIYFSNPTLPGCVGAGCSLPSGYNDVVDATLNEQSLHAYNPSSKYWTGGGRVETKIRVNGAGVGTVRVYYTYNGVNCNAGYAVYVFKLSGNVNYPNLPLSGYFDVILTSSDQGTFSYYTRCSSSGSHVGDYGIDSLWYSLTDPTTWTPTPTATLTNTPTFTPSPTPTLTSTPTFAPTNTFVPGTPHANGSGTCWKADWSWSYYNVAWRMDTNVPTSWGTSLYSAAQTWTNVTPSPFSFVVSSLTDNTISYGAVANYVPAFTYQLFQGATLLRTYTVFNNDTSNLLFETNIPPSPTSYSVQEIMTHEFGHWLALDDIPTHDDGVDCTAVTMFGGVSPGETKKITLETADIEAVNWQYP